MKKRMQFFGFIVLVAVIGFSVAACQADEDESIPSNWQGLYEYVFEDNDQTATVNIKSDSADFARFRNGWSPTDLSSGKISDLSVSGGGKIKSAGLDIGNWVYLYQGDNKAGIIVEYGNEISLALATSGVSDYVNDMASAGVTFSPSTPSSLTNPANSNFTITWFIGKKR